MAKQATYTDAMIERMSSILADKFEEHHVDDDVLSALDGLEASQSDNVKFLPGINAGIYNLRQLGLRFAYDLLASHPEIIDPDAALDVFFEISSILDRDMTWLLAHAEGECLISLTLTWASSAVLLAFGLESSRFDRISLCEAIQSQVSAYIVLLGGGKVKMINIEQGQHRLLKSLHSVPSVATWLSVYVERLRLCFEFPNPEQKYSLAGVKNAALGLAQRSVFSPLSSEFSPKQIAMSCLTLALYYSALLPRDFFTQGVSATAPRDCLQQAAIQIVFKATMDDIKACTWRYSIAVNTAL